MLLQMMKSEIARVLLLTDQRFKQQSFIMALGLLKLLFKLKKLASFDCLCYLKFCNFACSRNRICVQRMWKILFFFLALPHLLVAFFSANFHLFMTFQAVEDKYLQTEVLQFNRACLENVFIVLKNK